METPAVALFLSVSNGCVRADLITKISHVDFVILGAGQTGLQFLHAGWQHKAGSIAMVDERDGIGGHWRTQYDFVQTEQEKFTYGIESSAWSGSPDWELASRADILSHYDSVLAPAIADPAVTLLLKHTAHRVCTATHGPAVLCVPTARGSPSQLLVVRAIIIDASINSLPFHQIPQLTSDSSVPVFTPAMLPRLAAAATPSAARFVVVGGGKAACDAVLYLRRVVLGLELFDTTDRLTWVLSTPLAFLKRERQEELVPSYSRLLLEHTREPDAALSALPSYSNLFHHFTDMPPRSTHGATLGAEEMQELRQCARVEGERVARVTVGAVVLASGRRLPIGGESSRPVLCVACTGPQQGPGYRANLTKRTGQMNGQLPADKGSADAVTLFALLVSPQLPNSNHLLARYLFGRLRSDRRDQAAVERLHSIRRHLRFFSLPYVGDAVADPRDFFATVAQTVQNLCFLSAHGLDPTPFLLPASERAAVADGWHKLPGGVRALLPCLARCLSSSRCCERALRGLSACSDLARRRAAGSALW